MKLIRKVIFFVNILLVLVTLLTYLSPFVNPSDFWALSFLGLIFPLLVFSNMFFVFYWLITEWKRSWLSIACLLLGAQYFLLVMSVSKNVDPVEGAFSVASYNMNYAYATYKAGTYRFDKEKTTKFRDFIVRDLDADVFCGQESSAHIQKLIGSFYGYSHVLEDAGTAIYSRFPILQKGVVDFGTKTNSCVWADVEIGKDTVRFYSAHLQSNKISSEADRILEEAEQNKQVDMINVRTILSKYKRYVRIRSYQANKLKVHMDNSPHPVVLCGDLNDPPVSYSHRVLSENKTDAFVEAGNGLGITYAGNIPLLRIDNIIVDETLLVHSHKTIRKKYSDHYPVLSTLSLK